jgi:hypothetical protein
MDWFERLTGFREGGYEETRSRLAVADGRLRSLVNEKSYAIGDFELVSLQELRARLPSAASGSGRPRVSIVQGDVRRMHQEPQYRGALFQVASQFNALEMTGPGVTPEDGVTRYQYDRTQGPACAIAAGAATIYRNYFTPVGDRLGQTRTHQLDGLRDLGAALSKRLGTPVASLWDMRNGYALCSREGLDAIATHLEGADAAEIDRLRGLLRIGVQRDVEVTDAPDGSDQRVSQAFCSALPIAYSSVPGPHWRPFAGLVLEAAYEATMCMAALNRQRGVSDVVLLTLLGGGAFGNEEGMILRAMKRALSVAQAHSLDVELVTYGPPSRGLQELAKGVAS